MTAAPSPSISLQLRSGSLAALDRAYMRSFFRRGVPSWYPGERCEDVEIRDESRVEYKKSIRYLARLRSRSGRMRTVEIRGNIPSLDTTREVKTALRALRAIWGRSVRLRSTISKPLTFHPRLRMFLYESVPGIPLMVLLRRRQPGRFLWLEKSAAWLARLHQEKVPAGRPRTRARESQEAGYFLMNYRGFSPSCVPRAKELLRLFFAYRARLVPSRSSVLLHGDYNPNNVIVDRGRRSLSVIDFGNACRYDPMFDLANALVQLEYVTLRSRKEVENLTHRFFASYARFKSLTPIDERRLALFRIWWALQTLSFTMTLPMTTKKNVVPVIARTFRIADQSLRILSASP